MIRTFLLICRTGIFVLGCLIAIHTALQDENIYRNTLGKISKNYERIHTVNGNEVIQTGKPFKPVTNNDLLTWDAAIYNCINERMYVLEEECYGRMRAAFFPLQPLIWRSTGASAIGMSIINFMLFTVGMAILILLIKKDLAPIAIVTLLTLPSVVVFFIPYTEALFMFTMAVAAIGIVKERYWIYFIGAFLLAMVRPAILFVLLAIMLAQFLYSYRLYGITGAVLPAIKRALPFIAGFMIVLIIQRYYSGSWDAILKAQAYWPGGIKPIDRISDWSKESYGLSSFAIFFVCIPAICYSFLALVRSLFKKSGNRIWGSIDLLLLIAVFYIAGILVFTLLTSGGNLHSFHRFILASPLFYIALLIILQRIPQLSRRAIMIMITASFALLFVFLVNIEYTGELFHFTHFGMTMYILSILYLIWEQRIGTPIRHLLGLVIVLLNLVWGSYLLNNFLSDGWIFT